MNLPDTLQNPESFLMFKTVATDGPKGGIKAYTSNLKGWLYEDLIEIYC